MDKKQINETFRRFREAINKTHGIPDSENNDFSGNVFKTCEFCRYNCGTDKGKVLCLDRKKELIIPPVCATKKLTINGWMDLEKKALEEGKFTVAKQYRMTIINLAKETPIYI